MIVRLVEKSISFITASYAAPLVPILRSSFCSSSTRTELSFKTEGRVSRSMEEHIISSSKRAGKISNDLLKRSLSTKDLSLVDELLKIIESKILDPQSHTPIEKQISTTSNDKGKGALKIDKKKMSFEKFKESSKICSFDQYRSEPILKELFKDNEKDLKAAYQTYCQQCYNEYLVASEGSSLARFDIFPPNK